jgi:hypothetical protein
MTDQAKTDWEDYFGAPPPPADAVVDAAAMNEIGRLINLRYIEPAGGVPASDLDPAVQNALAKANTAVPGAVYASIAGLKAATVASTGFVRVQGYYAAGDGGGGVFRWDAADTTSADNGGTIITPTGGLASSGRWKRVYEGEVNARWFGMHPNRGDSDNTAPLQAAIDWVATDLTRDTGGGGTTGGTVFIPIGYYRFFFDAGTSGLSTITIPASRVTIRGEGYGTVLTVRGHTAVSDELEYFFTFDNGGVQGFGGGIQDLLIDGNEGQLTWGIYLPTWHGAEFNRIACADLHGGVLDAESNNAAGYNGEAIMVRGLETYATSGAAHTAQYGVRFRAGDAPDTGAWSDSWIENCSFSSVWEAGVMLDGVQRFTVRDIWVSNNATTSNTIDGTSKDGVLNGVRITATYHNDATHVSGWHLIDGIYFETHPPGDPQTGDTNVAVLIEIPDGHSGYIRGCRLINIKTDAVVIGSTNHTGFMKLVDAAGNGNLWDTSFSGNMAGPFGNLTDFVSIGVTVGDTYLDFDPSCVTLISPGATPTICTDLYKQVNLVQLATDIISLTTNATRGRADGQKLRVRFKDDGTPRNIVPGSLFRAVGVALSTVTTANKTLYWDCIWNKTDSKWDVIDVKSET